jgi:pimeloyl-ACP methyl ester carboxylesterase
MFDPLLLIHGFTDTRRTWDPLVPHLAGHHELLVPTLLGHHGGPPIPAGMTDPLAAMADELERELDRAGHDQVHIVGNSLGGWLAFLLAGRGRARSVVALSPAQGWPEDLPPAGTRRQFARAQRLAPVGARFAERVVRRGLMRRAAFFDVIGYGERVPPSTAAELIRGAADCPMFEPYTAWIEAGHYRDGWRELGVPTVIAWGTKDRTIPLARCSAWFRDALPDARWIDLPGCGHLPQHDDPELVASVILSVTGSQGAASVPGAPGLRSVAVASGGG